MEGFDYEKARDLIPQNHHEVHAMFAIGKRAPKSTLSKELEEKETPSGRKHFSEFVFEGTI